VLAHDARGGHAGAGTARTRRAAGTGSALAGSAPALLGTGAGALAGTRRTLARTGHALRGGEGVVAGTGTARTRAALTAALAGLGGWGAGLGGRTRSLRRGLLRGRLLRRGLGRSRGLRRRGGGAGLLRRVLGAGLLCGGGLGGGLLRGWLRTGLRRGARRGGAGGLLGGAVGRRELLAQTTGDGCLDGRGGGADELAHVLQLLQDDLAGLSELLGELVDADLSHFSPVSVRPTRGLGPL